MRRVRQRCVDRRQGLDADMVMDSVTDWDWVSDMGSEKDMGSD